MYEVKPYGLVHKGSEAHRLLIEGKLPEFHAHMKKLKQEAIQRGEIRKEL